ncbi:hypothetical protein GCM10027347_17610 [Larkinella harenae]
MAPSDDDPDESDDVPPAVEDPDPERTARIRAKARTELVGIYLESAGRALQAKKKADDAQPDRREA